MADILNHVDSEGEREHLAKKVLNLRMKLMMAKGLFWVSAGIAVVVWAIKS